MQLELIVVLLTMRERGRHRRNKCRGGGRQIDSGEQAEHRYHHYYHYYNGTVALAFPVANVTSD